MSDILMMRQILRIITPAEINNFTTTSEGENRISLTEIIDDEIDKMDLISQGLEDEMEEILLFKRKRDFRAGMSCKRLFKFMNLTNTNEVFINKKSNQSDDDKKNESSNQEKNNFLKGADGLREAQKKLKSAEVFHLYKKTSDVNTDQIKNVKDDLSKTSNIGILINKKQA